MMKATAEAEQDPLLQWVTFRLGDETYGVNVMQVQEVLRMTEIAPVPGAPHYVVGIVNLRGNVVTVMDARQRFGLSPAEPQDATRIIIVECAGHVIGVMVDSVAEVVNLRGSQIETAPNVGNDDNNRFVQGVYSRENDILILLDLDLLLGASEWADMEAV